MIYRETQIQIEKALALNKVLIILGARRVGKTTLVNALMEKFTNARYLNCELFHNKEALETTNPETLNAFFGKYKYLFLDEAQNIKNIGQTLKIIHDNFPEIKLIATGSSAFKLQQSSGEPLTGRSRFFHLSALSFREISKHEDLLSAKTKLEHILRFGLYPEIYNQSEDFAIEELDNIASNYLYKDILQFENLKKPDLLYNLLKTLALQIGSEVSLNELSNKLKVHVNTIKRYIELLEQNYVIFRLNALSNNPRNEIGKTQKIYFYDCGIRNAIIRNFNPMHLRNDVGQLWENFFITERMKNNFNDRKFVNPYFWRNYQQKEIDYIEEINNVFYAFECKYNSKKIVKVPTDFRKHYEKIEFQTVNSGNFWQFLT
ncbi:MAG: ATP-binding protein [Bacteroidota bacterium]|nr:ATP-binding protein [Bacteroidota bacterium]